MHCHPCGDHRALARRCVAALLAWLCLAAPAAARSELDKQLDQRITEIIALVADNPRLAGLTPDEKRKLVTDGCEFPQRC